MMVKNRLRIKKKDETVTDKPVDDQKKSQVVTEQPVEVQKEDEALTEIQTLTIHEV